MQFGDGVAVHLRSDADKALLLGDMHRRFGLRVPDAASGRRAHWHPRVARDLRAGRCVALLNARSLMQCYLYVARVEGIGEVSALVDRQVRDGHFYPRVVLARFGFDAQAYCGTVLDGELIQLSSGQHVLAIADARAVCGVSFADGSPDVRDLVGRHAAVAELLARHFRPALATDICAIRIKTHVTAPDLRAFAMCPRDGGEKPPLDYDVVALVFKPTRGGHCPEADLHVPLPPPAGTKAPGAAGGGHKNERTAAAVAAAAAVQEGEEDDVDEYDDSSEDDDNDSKDSNDSNEDDDGDNDEPLQEPARTFHVRSTHLPDCYELHDSAEEAAASVGCGTSGLLAGVPSLDASRFLQSVASGGHGQAHVAQFVMSPKFGKWVPRL